MVSRPGNSVVYLTGSVLWVLNLTGAKRTLLGLREFTAEFGQLIFTSVFHAIQLGSYTWKYVVLSRVFLFSVLRGCRYR